MVKAQKLKLDKSAVVADYVELLRGSKSVYLADYAGLTVANMETLRADCRKQSIRFFVIKNRLLRIAAGELGYGDLATYLEGPIAVVASPTDEVAPAKVIAKFQKDPKFAKDKNKPALKACVVDGSVYGPQDAQAFAALPSLEETRSRLLSVINGPAGKLVRLIAAPGTQLARVIDARKEKLG